MLLLSVWVTAVSVLCVSCASSEPSPPPTASPTTPTAEASDPRSIRGLIDSPRAANAFVVGDEADPLAGESAYSVSYESAGAAITGVLRLPSGNGPFPVVVVVHGSVDPAAYVSGRDLVPEQRALLDAGMAVLATDLRGYAGSDPADSENNAVLDPGFGWPTVLDWAMVLDVVAALDIAASGEVPQVDPDRVGLLGHSLGGLLAIDAAVVAPGSSDLVVALAAPTTALDEAIGEWEVESSGAGGQADLEYWRSVSPRAFFDRATEPLLLLHGSADPVAPVEWARATEEAWRAAGGTAELIVLDGADHHLEPRRDEAGEIIVQAFEAVFG